MDTIWAIDIGQCAIKALRCQAHDDRDNRIVADAFDYIEYPKILSQAGADPAELIGDALQEFLERNNIRGDKVAISVPGQSGLARFIKLPPVEAKKIPDIVRYEARQQIPFDLNDVIWDYQRMGGGAEEEGFALETEIGLFAMKRDAVFRALEPFERAGIEVNFVQLAPLSLYNFMVFDQLTDLPPPEQFDPDDQPDWTVVLSLGTDATDLVVTNGYRVWQRNIPLGGNHFTKALTKELKLTFAKAEHLKRNAAKAEDPKAVFQAMRPVFSDLLTEVQRSISYFGSIERTAKIDHIVALGNAMKLPGLRRYLSQSLGLEIHRLDEFKHLVGPQVLGAPAFKDNSLCFATCYGLGLQGLGKAGLQTNLLPKEIVHQRLIKQKKPWAVASAAVLLLGLTIAAIFGANVQNSVAQGEGQGSWKAAETAAGQRATEASRLETQKKAADDEFGEADEKGSNLVGSFERRILWLELLCAGNQCLPDYPNPDNPNAQPVDPRAPKQLPDPVPIEEYEKLHITALDCERFEKLEDWYAAVEEFYIPPEQPQPAVPPGEEGDPEAAVEEEEEGEGPVGEGWVVKITGYHYHNFGISGRVQGPEFVQKTLIKNLHTAVIDLPGEDRVTRESISVEDLGIGYATLVKPGAIERPDEQGRRRFKFLVHFCWQPTTPSERREAADEAAETPEE